MLVMVVFFIAFRWIHLSTPLIRLFLLVLILLLMPTLNFLPVWFALSLLRFRLPSRDRKSGSAGMPRPISYAVFCLKKKKKLQKLPEAGNRVALSDDKVTGSSSNSKQCRHYQRDYLAQQSSSEYD